MIVQLIPAQQNETNEFLTIFFKIFPVAREFFYYVNNGVLKPIGKEHAFQELVNLTYNLQGNQIIVSLARKYLDQQTKSTRVSQLDLILEKNENNWKIGEQIK